MCVKGDQVELVKATRGYTPGATGVVDNVMLNGKLVVTLKFDPGGRITPFPLPERDKSYFKKM